MDERLIPTAMWAQFSNAVQDISLDDRQERKNLCEAIMMLPQANRDTLAFLIQHFQRIAACPQTKMPLANLAKVFAPTIVGYSNRDLKDHVILKETVINVSVMQGLLKIPTEFWMQFVNLDLNGGGGGGGEDVTGQLNRVAVRTGGYPPMFADALSSALKTRKEKKFYGTPPYTQKRK